jgi:adenylosuccinate lyase
MVNIASGLEVHPARIRQRVGDELPFMATEDLIVRAVRAGGDRQAIHEVIRRHSVAAARTVKDEGKRNDMLERLAADPEYGVPIGDLREALDPRRFIGRAAEQVDEFLEEIVDPLLAGTPAVDIRDVAEVRV